MIYVHVCYSVYQLAVASLASSVHLAQPGCLSMRRRWKALYALQRTQLLGAQRGNHEGR